MRELGFSAMAGGVFSSLPFLLAGAANLGRRLDHRPAVAHARLAARALYARRRVVLRHARR